MNSIKEQKFIMGKALSEMADNHIDMNVWDYINSVIWYAVSQKTKNIFRGSQQ